MKGAQQPFQFWVDFKAKTAPALDLLYLVNDQLFPSTLQGIGNLHGVRLLALSNNTLLGSLPAEVTRLTSLHWLDLSNCSLSGRLPEEWDEWPFHGDEQNT